MVGRMTQRAPVLIVVCCFLAACSSASSPRNTPPENDDAAAATGGAGGQTSRPDATADRGSTSSPDTRAAEPDAQSGGEPDTGGTTTPDAGADAQVMTGDFPLEAVKAAKPTLFSKVNTQSEGPSLREGSVYFASDHQKVDFCNDLTIDAKGDIYFSNPHAGDVWRLSVAGALDKVVGGQDFPNGLEVDKAGTSLYLSAGGALSKIALPASGNTFPAPQKVGPGGADGMAFDEWGNLWLSLYGSGQLAVWDPVKKQVLASISGGSSGLTNICFGEGVVYTTVANKGLYKLPIPGVRGFLHPGAKQYTIKQMLDLKPVNDPL
jgi:SMP-30/gluconolaconase/LRE-like protein